MSNALLPSIDLSRILVIDDNPAIHADFRKVLQGSTADNRLDDLSAELFGEPSSRPQNELKFDVESAQQGKIGFEMTKQALAERRPFALAFVDMRMPPGWDGLETIEHLWSIDPQLQVVICTAYTDHSWSEVVERLGTNDRWLVLKKPFDNAEVCQLAAALTEKRRLSDQLQDHLGELEDRLDEGTTALREREQRLQNILDTAPDGIITFAATGVIESVNPAACELFAMDYHQAVGKSIAALLSGDNSQKQNEIRCVFSPEDVGEHVSFEMDSVRADGTIFPAQWTVGYFSSSKRQFYTAIVRDLTEHKQLQCDLAQAQKLESVGQLAAGIAHEINTPTQYVGDNVRFLRDSFQGMNKVLEKYRVLLETCDQDNDYRGLVDSVKQSIESVDLPYILDEVPGTIEQTLDGIARVASIVQAMKDFSHPGDEEKSLVDIHASLETSITVARNEWKYLAEMKREFDREMPRVPCLVGKLNQVFLNLIINAAHAIKAAQPSRSDPKKKGTITVRTSHTADFAVIEVSDTGTGIPAEIRGRIFDPFFTTKGVGQGTGQGLAIAHSVVVDKHGGTIEFFTEANQGTTFKVRLPLNRREA